MIGENTYLPDICSYFGSKRSDSIMFDIVTFEKLFDGMLNEQISIDEDNEGMLHYTVY